MKLKHNFKLILSRTDSIGDVVLTLPMAGVIKQRFPECEIYFLGKTYTKEVVALSEYVNGFINYDELQKLPKHEKIAALKKINADVFIHVLPRKDLAALAKQANIPLRVGTANRLYHWLNCNQLIKLSRKNSALHEAQLNFKLLSFLDINVNIALPDIHRYYGFTNIPELNEEYKNWLDPTKKNIILHPKSKGSAKEWGLENFKQLAELLPKDTYKVFISGTKDDGQSMQEFLQQVSATDITGKLSLQQFIAFIAQADGLVAASTGPLHIAAALNKQAIGLFSPKRPIHPGRWQPLGKQARYLVYDENCERCKKKQDCDCIEKIKPEDILKIISS